MLVEKSLKDALKSYIKGREVIVLVCDDSGRIDANLLSDFLTMIATSTWWTFRQLKTRNSVGR